MNAKQISEIIIIEDILSELGWYDDDETKRNLIVEELLSYGWNKKDIIEHCKSKFTKLAE